MRAFGIVFVIFILLSSGTFVNAAPPAENPGKPFDDVTAQLEEILAELAAIREDTENLQEEVGEVKEDTEDLQSELDEVKGDTEDLQSELSDVKDVTDTIRRTVKTAFEFELDSTSTTLGAVSFTIFGRCLLDESEGPCSFFELKKIVAPPLSNSVFLVLCVDNFTCSILQDRGYKIGFSVEGGFSLAAHGAGGSGANVDGPIIPIIPTNILKVSGLGPTSAKSIITIADVSLVPPQLGLKGKMKFVGERPLDMEILGWFLDPVAGFKCFDKDGSITCPPETTPSKTCFEVNLLPSIDLSEVKSILSAKSITDIKIPLKTKDFEICTDGTFTPPDLTGYEIFNNPVGSLASTAGDFCKITAGGLICNPLKLDTSTASPIIDANTIKAIDEAIGEVDTAVGEVDIAVGDVLTEIGEIGDASAAVDELLRCVTSTAFLKVGGGIGALDDNKELQKQCQLINFVNSIRPTLIDVQDALHDVCHDVLTDDAAVCHALDD